MPRRPLFFLTLLVVGSLPSAAAARPACPRHPGGGAPRQLQSDTNPDPAADSEATGKRLDVVVHVELVRVWPQPHGVDLVLTLVLDPGVDDVLGEHAAGEQEVLVRLERGECLVE
jgi:hypothetical protein